jgi:hypothetical protein
LKPEIFSRLSCKFFLDFNCNIKPQKNVTFLDLPAVYSCQCVTSPKALNFVLVVYFLFNDAVFRDNKAAGLESDDSYTASEEVKNLWSYPYLPPYAFMAACVESDDSCTAIEEVKNLWSYPYLPPYAFMAAGVEPDDSCTASEGVKICGAVLTSLHTPSWRPALNQTTHIQPLRGLIICGAILSSLHMPSWRMEGGKVPLDKAILLTLRRWK